VPRQDWDEVTVRDVMKPRGDDNTVDAGMETEALITSMMHPGRQSRYMVVDGDRLVGVIALKDVMELIALKMEIERPGGGR
jgi:CBS domain containing-hemolysin-like protein